MAMLWGITLDRLIEKLTALAESGHGGKYVVFDDTYAVHDVRLPDKKDEWRDCIHIG